jgi:1,4-alpha-glucan branching enzyme
MATISVRFEYRTGLRQPIILGTRLSGSWNAVGQRSEQWTNTPMEPFTADDGCPAFQAVVPFDDSQIGQQFSWGVRVDTRQRSGHWGIPTEVNELGSNARHRTFTLRQAGQTELFYLTHCRRLGANKLYRNGALPGIRFEVWAPNARQVELVRGEIRGGYIWYDNRGVTSTIRMQPSDDGIWYTDSSLDSALADFSAFDHTSYMFRITKDDGTIAYRTDIYSRCQIGSGRVNPDSPGASWSGFRQDLDGSKSCSVVVDPERVVRPFRQEDSQGKPVWPETDWIDADEFWSDEFNPNRPLPTRLDDLVIYEMHVDGLGLARDPNDRGQLDDAIEILCYLSDLGVNCIELMPLSQYEGWVSWGYGTSHYLAIEYAGGGRDQFKHFVKRCHQHGIAVIFDVVYNHYTPDGERAEWMYDSNSHERNIYYWYEGVPSDYPGFDAAVPDQRGQGGYIDNQSTGYAPRYWEEMVRKLFISSAAALVSEFHVDGFRVDQTTSIHSYAVLHADKRPANSARAFGGKFLREWTRTLQLINQNIFLIAEDYSGWSAVTQSNDNGGLGFQAVWCSEYYHHLVGDAQNDPSRARLLKFAGYGDNRELHMGWFAGAFANTSVGRVIYHESHDEAGNSYYYDGEQRVSSARTIVVAVNGATLSGDTRRWAEARTRVVAGVTLTAPGVPMFFMGEEVGAWEPYRYDDFLSHRQDFPALRTGVGARLFHFYQDLIRVRGTRASMRSRNIDILYTHDADRVLAFRRWHENDECLVVVSLNNTSFNGYRIQNTHIGDGTWREVLNSDAADYGGWGRVLVDPVTSSNGSISLSLPANSIIVLQRQ